jgi:outer membrane protein assembly factor BamD (BamD/ComL family)
MGRKQTRARKYVYFFITGLIFILLFSCAPLKKMKVETTEGEEGHRNRNLLYSQELLHNGDYEGALKECQKVLSLSSPGSPKDGALFNMGLIYAYPENPKKDYGKSLDMFKKLTRDHPQSPFVDQAKIWIGVLVENEKLNQTNGKLNQTNERLNQTIERLNQIIEKSKQVDIEIEEKKREKAK